MATIEQYESKLLSLDSSNFENLILELLEKEFRSFHNLNHTGKTAGKLAPRQGTPDIWFTTNVNNRERYIFTEVTTQKECLDKKIKDDLEKCKKHIEENSLATEKVIYACLGKTSPDQFEEYKNICKSFCNNKDNPFEFWGLDFLVHLLKTRYPLLSNTYLGVAVDNGSIVTITDYKNKFGVTEENTFLYRANEKEETERILLNDRCVILSGPAGCGKTRLALEIMKAWEIERGFTAGVLKPSGRGIGSDLDVLIDDTTKKYIILVDDANRLSHLGSLINFTECYSNIYLILTIRDYALNDIISSPSIAIKSILLKPLNTEQIKEVLKKGFGVKNERFLNRAVDISKGNLRFAIMMAESSLGHNNISTIPELLDVYYSTLKQDLKDIVKHKIYGKVLSVFAIFKRIYTKDSALIARISSALEITENDFLDACDVLEKQELLNYHFDNCIAEIADQILAEYLFYQISIVDGRIKLANIFDEFFFGRNQKNRIIEFFTALFKSYGHDSKIIEKVSEYKVILEKRNDESKMLEFYLSFHEMFEIDTLVFIKNILDNPEVAQFLREKSLSLLGEFCDTEQYNHAIDMLLLEYKKQTEDNETISKLLIERYTMTIYSYENDYKCQRYLIEKSVELAKKDREYEKLLYEILKKHFSLEHEYTTASHRNFTIHRIPFVYSDAAKSYRAVIWSGIKYLLFEAETKYDITDIVTYKCYSDEDIKIRRYDKDCLLSFFDNLILKDFEDQIRAIHLLGNYYRMNGAKERFKKLVSDPVLKFYADNIHFATGRPRHGEAYEKRVLQLIKSCAKYEKAIGGLANIESTVSDHSAWRVGEAITFVFNYIYNNNKEEYIDLLTLFMDANPKTQCQPANILYNALEILDYSTLLKIIDKSELEQKINWKMQVFVQIKEALIAEEVINDAMLFLTQEYINATSAWGNERATSFLRYEAKHKGFIYSICKVYYEKHKQMFAFKTFCESLFMNWEPIEEIIPLFNDDIQFMEDLYFELINRKAFCDYDAIFANYFIQRKPELLNTFFRLYIAERCEYISAEFLRSAPNIVDAMISYLSGEQHFYINYNFARFLASLPINIFNEFAHKMVQKCKNQPYEMFEISYIMEDATKEQQKLFIKVLIQENVSAETLEIMNFFDGPRSWSNSRVPYIEANIKALEELIEEEKNNMSLEYINFFKHRLDDLKILLKNTQISEFNDDFGV